MNGKFFSALSLAALPFLWAPGAEAGPVTIYAALGAGAPSIIGARCRGHSSCQFRSRDLDNYRQCNGEPAAGSR